MEQTEMGIVETRVFVTSMSDSVCGRKRDLEIRNVDATSRPRRLTSFSALRRINKTATDSFVVI